MARSKSRKVAPRTRSRSNNNFEGNSEISPSKEPIKAAEDLALAAFASGLKLAAIFGTVAAKTTSLALASIATGADKFSELVRQEAMHSQRANARRKFPNRRKIKGNNRLIRQNRKSEVLTA